MALRAVPDHPKFAELMAVLNLSKFAALGILEAVWHFTGRFTPQGNIGKYSDQAIEMWVGWNGPAGAMIEALVRCRWIDEDPMHRMLIHDWPDHADEHVHTDLARKCLRFANGRIPQSRRLNEEERTRFHEWLDKEGEPRPTIGRPKVRRNADERQPEGSQKAAKRTKPVPEPVPEPKISNASHSHPVAEANGELKPTPEELIYEQYPRKEGRGAAIAEIEKAVKRIRKGERPLQAIPNKRDACAYLFRRVQAYARSPAGTRPDAEHIPHPSTWFHQKRYLDDEKAWQVTGQEKSNGKSTAESRQERITAPFE